MKKDIEWLKKEISKRDKGTIYTCDLMCLINQLDEPEVLSQEWIEEHEKKERLMGPFGNVYLQHVVPSRYLKKLLVPKQEELETKIQELIESYKQEEDAYSNPENGWISGFIEDLKNLVEKEPMYYALIKGHDVSNSDDIYWNYDKYDNDVFVSRLYPSHDNFLTEMSKSEWNGLGINDSNADFVKVDNN